jgi:hypothetical protein
MYATGSKSGGPGVYHFESLPVRAASIDFFSDTKTQTCPTALGIRDSR